MIRLYSPKKNRIDEIDFIRGILILFMVVDHFFYDFTSGGALTVIFPSFYGNNPIASTADWYWTWNVRIVTRLVILCTFFFISGISCYFSKNNFKRGIILFIIGGLIDIGFYIFSIVSKDTSNIMFFGAISSFGTSILIFSLIEFIYKLIFKENRKYFKYICLCLGIIFIIIGCLFGVLSVRKNGWGPIESTSEITWSNFFFVVIGKIQHNGPDWLPIFPYIGFLFVGEFIGEIFYKNKKSYFPPFPSKPSKESENIDKVTYYSLLPVKIFKTTVCFAGKYSMYFYIFHQVVIILISSIVLLCLGYKIEL